MLVVTATITGKTTGDLDLALDELKRLLSEGYTSGANSNDSGGYQFSSFGETEEESQEAPHGRPA